MSNQKQTSSGFNFMSAFVAIVAAVVIGELIFHLILGAPSRFDAEGHPINGNFLGTMYKGGFVVPLLTTPGCSTRPVPVMWSNSLAR